MRRFFNTARMMFAPTMSDIFSSAAARRHLAGRVFTRIRHRLRPHSMPYTTERFVDELPQDLAWVKRKHLVLLGDNWLESEKRLPVALMWGFNSWKRDIIPGFLPEFRTAVLTRRTPIWAIWNICRRFRQDGVVIVTWSFRDTMTIRIIRKLMRLDLYRVEDGFIRSAALGAEHTPPESWVVDKSGLYFDSSQPSDLETILNTFDFDNAQDLLEKSALGMSLVLELGTTKYNLRTAETASSLLGLGVKKRVLVVGQVETDASIMKGGAQRWTNQLLVELAIHENPGAEIIYRPHPDVAAGLRKQQRRDLPQSVVILDKVEISLRELFDLVDHVYTITSLSGFEALLHNLKVTVVGSPFYAGWGLTDDRNPPARRSRQLTLQQLFAAAYILYPRYRGAPEGDNWVGFVAAVLAVTGDAETAIKTSYQQAVAENEIETVYQSRYWPALLAGENRKAMREKPFQTIMQSHGTHNIFGAAPSAARVFLAYIIVGLLQETPSFHTFLRSIRPFLKIDDYGRLVSDIWILRPNPSLLEHWIWYSEKAGDAYLTESDLQKISSFDYSEMPERRKPKKVDLAIASFALEARNLDSATKQLQQLALNSARLEDLLSLYAYICRLRFDFASSAFLLNVLNVMNSEWRSGAVLSELFDSSLMVGSSRQALATLAVLSRGHSDRLNAVLAGEEDLAAVYGALPFGSAFVAAGQESQLGSQSITRARALILSERHAEAEALLRKAGNRNTDSKQLAFYLSQALSFQGKLSEAKKLLTSTITHYPVPLLISEAMRVAILAGDYHWASSLIAFAETIDIEISEVNHRKAMLGLGKIKESYTSFRLSKRTKLIRRYIPSTYFQSIEDIKSSGAKQLTIISSYGPGDEIRFASLYEAMIAALDGIEVQFTSDPRLIDLLKRAMPGVKFVPTERLRFLSKGTNLDDFKLLPGSDLHVFFDNAGWDVVNNSPAVTLDSDLLGDVMEGYESFSGKSYLRAHPIRVESSRQRFAKFDKPVVGISWRSSLTTHTRNEHYLDIDMLMPVFEIEGIQFVNLQYDECREELAYVEARLPGRLVDLDGIDQYNDFEAVAACMEHMDLIISPVTTVTELAGALGRPTWLLSNSSELHWRVRPDNGLDVWHSSIKHIEGDTLGDKNTLVAKLRSELLDWREKRDRTDSAGPKLENRRPPA